MARKKDVLKRQCLGVNRITFQVLSMIILPSILNFLGLVQPGTFLTLAIGLIGGSLWYLIKKKYKLSIKFRKIMEDMYFTISMATLSIYLTLYFILSTFKNDAKGR